MIQLPNKNLVNGKMIILNHVDLRLIRVMNSHISIIGF